MPSNDVTREDITDVILDSAKRVMRDMKEPDRFELGPTSELLGGNGFDSIGTMTFLLELEQTLEERYGEKIPLADERALSQPHVPFKSVPLLSAYIHSILVENRP